MKAATSWNNVTVDVSGQDDTPFECQGTLISGSSTTLVDIPPAEYGGRLL